MATEMAQKQVKTDGAKGKFHVHTNLQFSRNFFFAIAREFLACYWFDFPLSSEKDCKMFVSGSSLKNCEVKL